MNVNVHVTTRSHKSAVKELKNEILYVTLRSAPIDGKANEELLELLSEYFDVPKTRLHILKGQRSRKKLIQLLATPKS